MVPPSAFGAEKRLPAALCCAAAVFVVVAPLRTFAGDPLTGYERSDYRTSSTALDQAPGTRLDLTRLANDPPLGLPALAAPLDSGAVDLGRRLFFDRRLSANGTLSCGMCHVPEQGFTQNELATPVGLEGRSVRRNAPALYNTAYLSALFLDGREASLEEQIWGPLLAANEMGNADRATLLKRIAGLDGYAGQFADVYGTQVTAATLGDALASYQRALLSGDSPFDRWYFGADAEALNATGQRGFELFTALGCVSCHRLGDGFARFTDDAYHNNGTAYRAAMAAGSPQRLQVAPGVWVQLTVEIPVPRLPDEGRSEVTHAPADRWRYRTPSLRNVALTGPYMHDGSIATLAEVVDYYDGGGSGDPDQDPRVRAMHLATEDKQSLVAFLEALTGSNVEALAADARSVPIGDRSFDVISQSR